MRSSLKRLNVNLVSRFGEQKIINKSRSTVPLLFVSIVRTKSSSGSKQQIKPIDQVKDRAAANSSRTYSANNHLFELLSRHIRTRRSSIDRIRVLGTYCTRSHVPLWFDKFYSMVWQVVYVLAREYFLLNPRASILVIQRDCAKETTEQPAAATATTTAVSEWVSQDRTYVYGIVNDRRPWSEIHQSKSRSIIILKQRAREQSKQASKLFFSKGTVAAAAKFPDPTTCSNIASTTSRTSPSVACLLDKRKLV